MTELTALKNIGKELERKLKSVGITSAEKLVELGSKETFFRLKTQHSEVCLVHLYAIEGAILGSDFNFLSEQAKKDLKMFNDSLR